jgi:Ca2+-binding RTX toxin-like protein
MNINTGNGNDIVTRPAFVNGAVYREADVIRTNGGDDVINPGLGLVDRVYGGTGFDHLILDYSVDDRWGGINFNMASNGLGSSYRNGITANNSRWVDLIQFSEIEKLTITGTSKDDSIFTAGGSHTIFAGAGNDTVRATAGYLDGGVGFDRLIINLSNQTSNLTLSNLSNIRITGVVTAVNFESFEITTGRGNDVVTQSAFINGFLHRANDVINTGAGNDVINAGLGQNDSVNGGEGLDHLIVDFSVGDTGTGMQFSTNLGVGRASRLVSPGSRTQLDNLTSFNIERFTVTGTSKDDSIQSANGNDILFGGAGNDVLSGRGGADILNGGAGVDTFRFDSLSDSLLGSHDVIQDLNIGTDVIDGPSSMGAAGVAASLVRKLGNVVSLTEAAIQRVLTPTTFVSNGASTFTFGNRAFVALNDARAGFSAQTDSLIEITGYRGNLSNLSIK